MSTILTVLHADSVDQSFLSQFSSIFQTIVRITNTRLEASELLKLKSATFKYDIQVDHRNLKSYKVITNVSKQQQNLYKNNSLFKLE